MEKLIEYLKQLELSELEAKLYLTLLKTGPITVRELAADVNIKRTTAYLYVDQLVEKGLVIKLVKGSKKLVTAEDPKNLETLIEKKLREAQEVKQNFPDILSSLNATISQQETKHEAEIKYYKGKNGVKKLYEEALQAQEVRSYVNVEEISKTFPDNYHLLDVAYKSNPNIKIFEICEDSQKTRERIKSANKNHSYKVLPKKMKLTSTDVLIYEDKIAIIDLKGATSGIVLSSSDLSKNFQLLFNCLWDVLPD
ncbi:MAG: winged helix-turn-helix transcriptional regulator [Candidatus Levybacteria bacterium]|nr:winged helix-turn-helix transcriptional regulator [Candidatus Levybacteria bacterium]